MENKKKNNTPAAAGGNEPRSNASGLLDQYAVQPRQQEDKSPYYKSAAPSIAMPKGGGALKGIDEKFSVNAVNGTAGLEISLPLTPGRSGFTPALGLSYNSGGGNSEFGLGWGMSLPAIQRKTDKRLPLYNDAAESDTFLLAGAEDLVPELDTNGLPLISESMGYTIKRYRPRIEGLFARIEYITKKAAPGAWWRVTTKENITTYYGLRSESRIADPVAESRIYKWLPDIIVDHKGNAQVYTYVAENLSGVADEVYERNRANGNARFANTYLKQVQYGNTTPYFIGKEAVWQPALPQGNWLFEMVLDYGDYSENNYSIIPDKTWLSRIDAFSDFHAGFEVRTYRLCRRMLMFHRFQELNNGEATLVSALELAYKNESSESKAAETDYIISATQRGYTQKSDGSYTSATLPSMRLKYSPFRWNTNIVKVAAGDFTGAPQGLTGPYQWTDFEGEGISGILTEQGNGWFYKNNLGNGHFAAPKAIADKPSFSGLGRDLQWQDLDADGRRQVVTQTVAKGYWELDDNQQWQPFQTFDHNLNIDLGNPFTKMLDLNGDGRPDLLITEDRAWIWYENLGKEGFEKGGNASLFSDEEKGPLLLLRDTVQSIFLADMNGDGMTDLVRISNGEVCYWPNMGYGRFGAKVTMGNAPFFAAPDLYNPLYITLSDISGTGAADIIFTGENTCKAWINLSGNAFSDAYDINPLPGTDAYSKITVVDFLGNGTGCLVWSSPLPAHAHAPLQYIDLMGGRKPHLLEHYYNGTGKSVRLHYKSSTRFYLEDKLQGIAWATQLPFPVHCISKVTTSDVVSRTRYSQDYRYRHGYYDHEEREFRGFGFVETVDIDSVIDQSPEAPGTSLDQYPVKTKTWYHTGAWIREQTLIEAFQQEYFPFEGWDTVTTIALLPEGLNAQEHREAHRALKGSALRQEVYALDKTAREPVPYTVAATAYEVKKVQALGNNRFASFISLQSQQVTFNCERDLQDPRIRHQLTLETDRYGHVLQSAEVAYKRKSIPSSLPAKVKEEQAKMHIVWSQTHMTGDAIDDTDHTGYRIRLPFETKSYEAVVSHPDVEAGKLWTITQLKTALDAAVAVDFAAVAGNGQKRLLSHSRTRYRADDALSPLPFGTLAGLAITDESYQMAFTPGILADAYGGRVDGVMLGTGNAAYVDLDGDGHYWAPSGKAVYSSPATQFYTPELFLDPWGNETKVKMWGNYWLLPERTNDALENEMAVKVYNWRNLRPVRIQDMNRNIVEMLYDALGMPVAMAVKGKDDGTEGDELAGLDPESTGDRANQHAFWQDPGPVAAQLLQNATWRCVYDFDTLPVAVAMIARQHHVHGAVIPDGQDSQPLIRFSYSDGLDRVLMHKIQAAPSADKPDVPRWISNGRTIYNNKGTVVMQFEPYFSDTHLCDTAEQADAAGISPRMFYDPLNRLRETKYPDGTFAKTAWTAWEQTIWDNNDTVKSSDWYAARINGAKGVDEQEAAQKAAAHNDTPVVKYTDSLARPFYSVEQDGINIPVHSYESLDISGNRIAVTDGNGNVPLRYKYNMLQHPCAQLSQDSGNGLALVDVAGQPIYAWDAEDRRFTTTFDGLRRPLEQVVRHTGIDIVLEKTEYGETVPNAETMNLRGQIFAGYNGAGKQVFQLGYDFKGLPLETWQYLLEDPQATDVDWAGSPLLAADAYIASAISDALGRPVSQKDAGGYTTTYRYDKAGALKTLDVAPDGAVEEFYIRDIRYNALGQREYIRYGNNTVTRYTYDKSTLRLRRLQTTAGSATPVLRDLNYYYDPVGNITRISDKAQQDLFFANTIVSPDQVYTYDALYRLIEARGREQIGTADFGAADNTRDGAWKVNLGNDAVQSYTQKYTYDAAGNILKLQHIAGSGSYTRNYTYGSGNNRLLQTAVNPYTYSYDYDARGNMTAMPHLDGMRWNTQNQLSAIQKGTMEAAYQYVAGQRIRKYVKNGNLTEERIYLGDFEIYRKFDNGSLKVKRHTVHISDDSGRVAMLEIRKEGLRADDGDTEPNLVRYLYANHLQSTNLELDESGVVISYEEYHPYGTTAFQARSTMIKAAAKRYRYTGKERDEESGLYYHGARYYIPWLCRWSAADPMETKYAGRTPYSYCNNQPVSKVDPEGEEEYNSYEEYKQAKGNKALSKMDGSDGAWLKSDRTDKNATWSNAMGYITKNDLKGMLVGYTTTLHYDKNFNGAMVLEKDQYNFDIVRDYYNWIQHQVDALGYSTQWAKGASYLVDELADTYQDGVESGAFMPKLGKLLNDLNQGIANYAVGRFNEVLYQGKIPADTKQGWYEWDQKFIMQEQVTVVAPKIYESYAGTSTLDRFNSLSRKETFLGFVAAKSPGHFLPDFSLFGVSINKQKGANEWSNNFGALGRYHIPLLMLYPYTHGAKFKLTPEQWKDIQKSNKQISNYYQNKMKY
ncbi:SpvB/TcaC N-terminal domain-containing protein [Taibaiella chishuiensis]|uniref:RHS repeat-associated protein n=1 Tax=Taibaiella chishuiensis TaxID=1434707 RepID=A0A2P8D4G4_9BACT|nr:SpvB/TcaC N-terminal domain-containing protein [Taibaiella chishuiensis]PSK92105.1 RHS repeat-associated protein [Taibaiella chishuiensis]